MPTELTLHAAEEGTYVIDVAFTDEDDDPVVPNVITWTLTDLDGNVINSRNAVAVASPAASIAIVLTGNDLVKGIYPSERALLVEWTYDSDLGTGLPMKAEARFHVDNLIAVT